MIKRKKKMSDQSLSDKFAAIIVALLLLLMAWGNATVMLIVSILGLGLFMLIFRHNILRGSALAAAMGFVLSIGIALATLFW